MTGLAVVLGLAVLSMAEVAVDRFREVMDRNVRVFLAVGERVASLVDVGVAGQALFRRDGLEAVLVAHRAVLLVLGGRRNGDIGGVGAGREKSGHGDDNEFLHDASPSHDYLAMMLWAAMRPKTMPSRTELPPRRVTPWTPPVISPAA